jgi:hypothetical protein
MCGTSEGDVVLVPLSLVDGIVAPVHGVHDAAGLLESMTRTSRRLASSAASRTRTHQSPTAAPRLSVCRRRLAGGTVCRQKHEPTGTWPVLVPLPVDRDLSGTDRPVRSPAPVGSSL